MLDRIIIGTANFTQSYGILSNGKTMQPEVVNQIFAEAHKYCLKTVDTAFAYGDLFNILTDEIYVKDLKIISKFSVLDDFDQVCMQIKEMLNVTGLRSLHALLVHDPQNLSKADRDQIRGMFNKLRDLDLVEKIGVSIYDIEDAELFHAIMTPDIIQLPFNPLNQALNNVEFREYLSTNNIEVHARSLYLQGLLLANMLPASLKALETLWDSFNYIASSYSSKLEALLLWANNQSWIDKWVLGVSSFEDFKDLINQAQITQTRTSSKNWDLRSFDTLKNSYHPLADPRNWSAI